MAAILRGRGSELGSRLARALQDPDVKFGQTVAVGVLAVLIFFGFLFPISAPRLAQGAILGMLSALIAMGIVLIYRANRIINFAQGDLGALAGVLAVSFMVGWKMPFWVAVLIGLAAGIALGGIVEVTIIRRFAKAPRLILSVATIGIATIMQGLQLWVPTLFGYTLTPQTLDQPLPGRLIWGTTVFQGGSFLVLLVVPVVGLGLAAFFRRSRVGQAVRASAESADRASLLGIPVKRINTLVWVLAAALSALAAVLRTPIVGVPIGQVLGPGLLLRALAAAVIGRMENLTVTFFAAIGLAMAERAVFVKYNDTVYADAVIFAVILGALLIQRRGQVSRALERGASTWQAIREVRPIPPELRRLPEVRWGMAGVKAAVVALLVFVPLTLSISRVNLLAFGLLVAMLGVSLVILTGWAGQISLGQWAFAGFGGAVAGSMVLDGHHLFLALLAAGLVGAAVSIVLGLPSLRIRGPFLAVTTLAFALATSSYFLNEKIFGFVPSSGERIARPTLFGKFDLESEWTYYYFVLAVFGVVLLSVRSLRNSRTGRALLASRENERAVQTFGVSLTRIRLTGFAIAGFIASLSGALVALHQQAMFDSPLRAENSLRLFSIAVFGGLGSIPGVLLGAGFFTYFDYFVRDPYIRLITSGAGLLLVLLAIPGGLGQLIYDVRDRLLKVVAARRGIVVPSLVADLRVDEEGRAIDGGGRRRFETLATMVERARDASRRLGRRSREEPAVAQIVEEGNGHRRRRRDVLLSVRGLDVAYGQTQVLFGVDFHVERGEIVALLGTNGAGKSTLLSAISGLVKPARGSVTFDGRDITGRAANLIVADGIVLVPGGRGVFPTLTVEENLRLAGWLYQREPEYLAGAIEQVLEYFPILRERWTQRAGNLSGGEQQMLTLGQAFIARPQLLMIDELSLGLAPVLVEQLLEIVRAIHRNGTTVVLVEQSVNVAVTIAERAVFMEKGEVRFTGPITDLFERPDILRAVFLGRAARAAVGDGNGHGNGRRAGAARTRARERHRFEPECKTCGRRHEVALATREISVSFGGIRAVDGVSLEVRDGEILGIIGPNGAGKTTVFDAISGFVPAAGGGILLGETDITHHAPDARAMLGLGRSFQDARLFPALTVFENLAVALERHIPTRDPLAAFLASPATRASEKWIAERVEELVELTNLGAFSNKFVSELSTGTRRVVDLACTLAHDPKVLLLDEPSSGIAQKETEALAPLLLDIRERTGAALIVIEHDMPLITTISDRMIALELGRVIAEGTPDEVVNDPLVVISYLGESEEIIARSGVRAARGGGRQRQRTRAVRRERPLRAVGARR